MGMQRQFGSVDVHARRGLLVAPGLGNSEGPIHPAMGVPVRVRLYQVGPLVIGNVTVPDSGLEQGTAALAPLTGDDSGG
ncbi:hypothetical protein NONI108955_21350 [Nocardia ninae]